MTDANSTRETYEYEPPNQLDELKAIGAAPSHDPTAFSAEEKSQGVAAPNVTLASDRGQDSEGAELVVVDVRAHWGKSVHGTTLPAVEGKGEPRVRGGSGGFGGSEVIPGRVIAST